MKLVCGGGRIFVTHVITGLENRKIQAFNGYRIMQKVTY